MNCHFWILICAVKHTRMYCWQCLGNAKLQCPERFWLNASWKPIEFIKLPRTRNLQLQAKGPLGKIRSCRPWTVLKLSAGFSSVLTALWRKQHHGVRDQSDHPSWINNTRQNNWNQVTVLGLVPVTGLKVAEWAGNQFAFLCFSLPPWRH